MDTKDIILKLRTGKGMSQDELAEKVFVTRQAVSRWETGETTPNTETLKLLSKLFDVSINTLLGSPRQLICQCCGMPLDDADISRETDGFFNEEYCKWCYADGEYMYHNMDDLIEVCVQNMTSENFSAEQAREYMADMLPKLNYWKRYEYLGGAEKFEEYKQKLIDEINGLNIDGLPKVEKLNALVGKFINLEYRLPNGTAVKFLDDNATYLGNELECEYAPLRNRRKHGFFTDLHLRRKRQKSGAGRLQKKIREFLNGARQKLPRPILLSAARRKLSRKRNTCFEALSARSFCIEFAFAV